MTAIDKFRAQFKKITDRKSDQWLEKIPAWTGDYSGIVNTGIPGMIYVRVDGQVVVVFNQTAPAEHNIPVLIGRHKDQPHLWQVIGSREVWSAPASSNISHHGWQHGFMQPDMTPIDRRQILALTVMVSDAANFIVRVYGGLVHTANGIIKIANQDMDLSSYVITSGAKYINIESDDDGTLTVNEGSVIAAPDIATASDIPVPADGFHIIATILLYESQTKLSNSDIAIPMALPGPSGGGVTNGDSHDHVGGDGAQIDHGGLAGLGDDDHTQYIKHSLATAINDFLIASGSGAFVKKTLAQVADILGIAFDVSFESYQTTPHTLTSGGNTVLKCNTETKDTHNYYNATTGVFTPLIAGTYEFHAVGAINSLAAGKEFWIAIRKNGGSPAEWEIAMITGAAGSPAINGTAQYWLDGVDDYVDVVLYHTHGSDRNSLCSSQGYGCRFMGKRISPNDLSGT